MKMAENVVIPSLTIPVVKKKNAFFFFLFSFLDHCPSLRASWLEEMVARNEQLSLIIDLSVTKINGSLNQRTRQKEPCRRGEFQPPLARHGDRLYVCESNFIHNGGDDGNNTKFPARPTAYFSDKDMKSHQCVCVCVSVWERERWKEAVNGSHEDSIPILHHQVEYFPI